MGNPIGKFSQETGLGTWEDPQGNVYTGTLADLTGGRWIYDRGQVVDSTNLFNRTSIGQQGPFTVEQLNSGSLSVVSQTRPGAVTTAVAGDFLRSVKGDIQVQTALGTVEQFSVEGIPINGINNTWVAYPKADGSEGWTSIPGRYRSQAELDAALPTEGFRLANPYEAAGAALRKRLFEDTTGLVDRYVRDNGITAQGDNSAHYIAIGQILAAADLSGLTFHSSFILE